MGGHSLNYPPSPRQKPSPINQDENPAEPPRPSFGREILYPKRATTHDKQDRAGRADLNTAKTFYAASIFFDIINQFGPLQPDLEKKQKYAVWKAADIRKALKEGSPYQALLMVMKIFTSPQQSSDPSPQFHEANNQHYTNIPTSSQFHDKIDGQHSLNISPSPHSFPSAGYPLTTNPTRKSPNNETSIHHFRETYLKIPYTLNHTTINPINKIGNHIFQSSYDKLSVNSSVLFEWQKREVLEPSPTPTQKYQYDSNWQPPPEKIAEAHKAARFAIGALAFDNVSTAVEHLKKSVELLTNPSASQ
ncbi:Microtubule-associated proteins 65-1 isoform 1 [Hibiscus syriacus]|uniref:Microtubule-associated proteins 65-1 isoform 1 n=1 Tax=Hibiscus syriacus TaxID=106335 RepID=A0A6A3CID1_HIBSY|nr:Microtubule-associated proteins 65-1 isoform 1 [Hibiscus syriacus]